MPDFLLELLSEEIPARMQAKASADLARLFAEELAKSGLAAERIEHYATPRRLALIARTLPAETQAVSEELKGPRASAPPQALDGFLRKTGLTRDQLVERDGILFAVIDRPGRATADVIAEAVPAIVRAFPWPKSMRWGAASLSTSSLRWVRPLHGIVALLDGEIVPVEIDGIASGAETVGHRFHHPGPITIGCADDYAAKLRACHVILDPEERKAIIADGAAAAARDAGLTLVEDEGLLAENAGLTEWPVPLLGGFDPAFLDVPREVIQLTMRTNQKYFACVDGAGELAPNFICTANIDATDGGKAIVAGNEKVLAARLSDAKFFWEQDLKTPLEEQAKKLDQIVFHEKLGTVADKVDRVAKLARWLVEEGIVTSPLPLAGGVGGGPVSTSSVASGLPTPNPSRKREGDVSALATLAETAARLCKADLVTGMVGEFPELQGVMGGHYARAQGLDPQIADAIRDHYKPVGQGDEVPTAPVTVAVSLADKLDSLAAFFVVDETPTGSKDPFALRRSAISVVALIVANNLRLDLGKPVNRAVTAVVAQIRGPSFNSDGLAEMLEFADLADRGLIGRALAKRLILETPDSVREKLEQDAWSVFSNECAVTEFIRERLQIQQRDNGVSADIVRAVFAARDQDDLISDLARVKALQAFVATEDGANLLAGYKRAANILKKEGWPATPSPPSGGEGKPERSDGRERGESGVEPAPDEPSRTPPSPSGAAAPPPSPPEGGEGKKNSLSYTPLPEESALIAALDSAEPRAAAAVQQEDFEGAMTALASLRGPIDAFFDKVTVNDPDPAKRKARLNLLARIRDAVHQVADFSRIEG